MSSSTEVSSVAARTVPGLHQTVLAAFLARVPVGRRVLDLGAGTGAWVKLLHEHGYVAHAVERDPSAFGVPEVKCLAADLNAPFARLIAESFDAITSIEVVEHLENPRAFLRECSQLLRPGGLLFLTTPNFENVPARLRFLATGELRMFGDDPRFNDPTHITPIHSSMFRRMVRDVGLELEEHRFSEAAAQPSRLLYRGVTALLAPLLRGVKGGDCHVFVLRRPAES